MDQNIPNSSPTVNPVKNPEPPVNQPPVEHEQSFQLNQTPATTPPPIKKLSIPVVIVLLILSFLGGLFLASWYYQNQLVELNKAKKEVAPVTAKNELIIGTDPTAPPMESLSASGTLIGYDIDLGNRIADGLDMKAKFVSTPWDTIFEDLENGKIDVIISSVTINEERKQKYGFSEPYINAGQVIVSRKDNQITSVEQLRGKRISVQKGTTNENEALKYTAKELVISYDEFVVAANAVSVASAEAMISDLTMAKGFIEKYDNLKITTDPFTNEYYGVVIRKDNVELQKKVNDVLSVLRVNGVLTDLKQKWLE